MKVKGFEELDIKYIVYSMS